MRLWVALVALLVAPATAAADTCAEPLTVVFERVSPSVVAIQAMKINKAKPQRRFETVVGSGVIIEKDGQILTNAHVVDGAASLSVTLDSGNRVTARILGLDPVLDLALLRVDTAAALPAARLGDSSGVRVGDEVVAIGNPLGLDQTMTRGIVSALNRLLPGISDEPMIQTDAPINPGNSGGPLVDRCGNVIGINTLISEDAQSIGFAVPMSAAKTV
jgi:S1-C subfamily serine protease